MRAKVDSLREYNKFDAANVRHICAFNPLGK